MNKNRWALTGAALTISAFWGCAPKNSETTAPAKQEIVKKLPQNESKSSAESQITLNTADGWSISGAMYLPAGKPEGGVILLHQRGGTGEDWKTLSSSLQEAGYAALAIDQRGAGKSTAGPGPIADSAPWDTTGDIAAAVDSMKQYGKITLIGASYGANNALIYAAAHPDQIQSVVLLSPGENYNGLEALPAAQKYSGQLLILTDKGDTVAKDGPEKIDQASTLAKHSLIQYDGDGHGTELLRTQSVNDILDFVKKNR